MFKWFQGFHQEKTSFLVKGEKKDGSFWDPSGDWIKTEAYEKARREIDQDFKKYQESPHLLQRNFYLLCIPLMLFAFISGWYNDLMSMTDGVIEIKGDPRAYGLIGFGCFVIPTMYRQFIHNLQRDYIKALIADKYKWLYNPEESKNHWAQLRKKFPEIFDKGNDGQKVHDEFWGNIQRKNRSIPFYSSVFEYTVVSGSGKNRKRTTYYQTIFAFRLSKSIKAEFLLSPEGFGNRLFKWFGKKEIDTESNAFNESFAFSYDGKKDEKALEIVKTLSPAVQDKLLDLKKSEKYFSFLFKGDAVVFSANGKLLKKMHTNFFRKVEIDPRDEQALKIRMKGIMDIVGDITPYLS